MGETTAYTLGYSYLKMCAIWPVFWYRQSRLRSVRMKPRIGIPTDELIEINPIMPNNHPAYAHMMSKRLSSN